MISYWVFGCSVQLTCSPSRHQNPRSMAHIRWVGYWVGQTWISPRILESLVPFLMTHRSPLPIGTSSLCWRSEKISQKKRSQIFKLIGTMYIYQVILCPSVCFFVCLFFCRFLSCTIEHFAHIEKLPLPMKGGNSNFAWHLRPFEQGGILSCDTWCDTELWPPVLTAYRDRQGELWVFSNWT